MKAPLAVATVLLLGACTPPRVYREGFEPAKRRAGDIDQAPRGTLAGRMGPASGAAGIAFFATENSMYTALAELFGGPVTQGLQTYENFEVTTSPTTEEQARAVETLQSRAARSARESARTSGEALVSVEVHVGPHEPDGSFLLRVESVIESKEGIRHRELRDAVVRPRGQGAPAELIWLGPPRLAVPGPQ